jgi:hypothetical protein
VKISEQRAATLPVNPMSIRADCPIQLADNLKSRADFPWLPQAAEGIRDFIKLNLATSKLAA